MRKQGLDMRLVEVAQRHSEEVRAQEEERQEIVDQQEARDRKVRAFRNTVYCIICGWFAATHVDVFFKYGLKIGEGILVLACLAAIAATLNGDWKGDE